jgi:Limiting CO2-inducible proteins B/C beta carbonyic anhydrases
MKTNRSESPLDVVRGRYPNALSTSDTVDAFLDLMGQRLGIAPGKIMLADSICSDDLNIIEYPKRAYEMLGPFKLRGLDGFPFAGLTGMGAFVLFCGHR